jgi:hypothetical protein
MATSSSGYWTTQDAIALIEDLIDSAWEAETPEQDACFPQYFNVDDFGRGEYVDIQIGGLGQLTERELLEDMNPDSYEIGPELRVIPRNFGRMFRTAEETLDDLADAGPFDGKNVATLGAYADVTKRWKRSAWWTADVDCATKILNGTSTAADYIGRDGGALLGTHTTLKNPPQSQVNFTSAAALTQANVYSAITALDGQLDDKGDFIENTGGYILLHGLANKFTALEILKTERQLNTNNWNKNLLKDEDITPVMCKYLGTTYTGWWVISKKRNPLNFMWRQKPKYAKDVDFDANAIKYKVTSRWARFHKDWRGIAGYPTS